MQFKIGDIVYWDYHVNGKKKGRIIGRIFEKKPSISPGAKYGISSNGRNYYPLAEVHKYQK